MTQTKHNLAMMVIFLTLLEGGVIYLNLIVHPDSQPGLTLLITCIFAIAAGLSIWYSTKVRGIIFT